jgi:hypothetical protein
VAAFWGEQQATVAFVAVACIFPMKSFNPGGSSQLHPLDEFRFNRKVAKYWETIVEKLKSDGWQIRWVEAVQDGESGWTATAIRGRERHSTHANDITLAFQELEANCAPAPKQPVGRQEFPRKVTPRRHRLRT